MTSAADDGVYNRMFDSSVLDRADIQRMSVMPQICFYCSLIFAVFSTVITDAAEGVVISAVVNSDRMTRISCEVRIRGKMITPSESGTSELNLNSDAAFRFDQRQFESRISGPFSLRAYRNFQDASVRTVVGTNHKTVVQLPGSHRILQVYGTDSGLWHLSSDVRLTRQQVDLLQLPCDPLVAAGLLPTRALSSKDEKWNADTWVVPMLVGMEAVVSQSATCQLADLSENEAVVQFEAAADGAVTGSASKVVLTGKFTLDRRNGIITQLQAIMKEQRSPGTVSPGLNITAEVQWTQAILPDVADQPIKLPLQMPEELPEAGRLRLSLSTPWRLMLSHSRDWYLFHETPELVVLRMLQNGALIAQCNIAPALIMPPGEFTADDKFRSEVKSALVSRQAVIVSSRVIPVSNEWRKHFVRAVSETDSRTIYWDYYLCTHAQGEQFLLIFSHSKQDAELFGDAATQLLETLSLPPARERIRLPR